MMALWIGVYFLIAVLSCVVIVVTYIVYDETGREDDVAELIARLRSEENDG